MDPVCRAVEQYFLSNEVEDVGKRRIILLSVCGSKTYALARDLLQPAKPAETTFKKIVDTLEKHFSPKPSEIVERYKFHSRNRKEDEGVAAYVAELRKLTEHCNFGESLPEMLRDRLVCGIKKYNENKSYINTLDGGFGRTNTMNYLHRHCTWNIQISPLTKALFTSR